MVDPSGNSWKSFWQSVGNWFDETFGFGLTYENITLEGQNYYLFFDFAYGKGVSGSDNKPVNFFVNMPEQPWKVWDYSVGIDFHKDGKGFQFYIGTDVGIGWYNEKNGSSISFDGSGRLKFISTINEYNSNKYDIFQFEINTHIIFAAIMAAIYAPYLLEGIGALGFAG